MNYVNQLTFRRQEGAQTIVGTLVMTTSDDVTDLLDRLKDVATQWVHSEYGAGALEDAGDYDCVNVSDLAHHGLFDQTPEAKACWASHNILSMSYTVTVLDETTLSFDTNLLHELEK